MSGPSDKLLKRIIGEIHRRSLWQVLVIYVAASWGVLEAITGITEVVNLPDWLPAVALVLLLIGLPIVLATAFVQEGGPSRGSLGEAKELDEIFSEGEPTDEIDGGVHDLFTWRNAILGGMAAFALWGVLAAGWMLFRGTTGDEGPGSLIAADETRPAVAVLPFANLSPDEENAYFADGVHEDILTHLSKVGDLTVLARTSVLRYRDTEKSMGEIAAELGAHAVLEGSVRRAGDQIRIVVQLIDPGTDGHLWAETYDRRLEVDNVFTVQTEIARRVTRALEATLSPAEEERIAKRPTESLAAYDLYLKGREAYNQYDDEENDEAIRLFREALELDPGYALAWAGLGDAFAQRVGRFGYPRAWADSAVRAASRTIDLDPELAEGHKALGLAYLEQGRIRDALEANLRTVELDPNHHGAVNNIGVLYQDLGRFDETVGWYERSVRLAPNDLIPRTNLAYAYTFLGMQDAAKEWLDGALALDPEHVLTRLLRALHALYGGDAETALGQAEEIVRDTPTDAFAWTGAAGLAYMARDFERAVAYARESLRLAPDNRLFYWHFTETLLGLSLMKSGDRARGADVLRRAMEDYEGRIEEGDERYQFRWDLAAARAALDEEEDAALEWLERSYDAGFRFFRWPKIDPAFDDLRDDPRLQDLVGRMDADFAEMRERVIRERGAAEGF